MKAAPRLVLGLALPSIIVVAFLLVARQPVRLHEGIAEWRPAWLKREVATQPAVAGNDRGEHLAQFEPMPLFAAMPDTPVPAVPPNAPPHSRYVSPAGTTYLVLSDWPAEFCGPPRVWPRYVVARRAAGRPQIQPRPAGEANTDEAGVAFDAWVDSGDEIIQRGVLCPDTTRLFILDEGDFIAVDGTVTQDLCAVRRGTTHWATTPRGLFGDDFVREFGGEKALRSFPAPSCVLAAWVDAEANAFVALGWDDRVAALDLDTGVAQPVDGHSLALAGLRLPDDTACSRILDAARRQHWEDVVEPARQILAAETRALPVRLRAALFLADHADLSGLDVVLAVCNGPDCQSSSGYEVRSAWASLGRFLGAEALPMYTTRLHQGWESGLSEAVDGAIMGLAAMGVSASDAMLEVVLAHPLDRSGFYRAGKLLGRLRDGAPWDDTRLHAIERDSDAQVARWQAFIAGDSEALPGLLMTRWLGGRGDDWSVLLLPTLRQVQRSPQASFAKPIESFLVTYDGGPLATPAYVELVRAEAHAALAAISAAR